MPSEEVAAQRYRQLIAPATAEGTERRAALEGIILTSHGVRLINLFEKRGRLLVGDVRAMTREEILELPNAGQTTIDQVTGMLRLYGMRLSGN